MPVNNSFGEKVSYCVKCMEMCIQPSVVLVLAVSICGPTVACCHAYITLMKNLTTPHGGGVNLTARWSAPIPGLAPGGVPDVISLLHFPSSLIYWFWRWRVCKSLLAPTTEWTESQRDTQSTSTSSKVAILGRGLSKARYPLLCDSSCRGSRDKAFLERDWRRSWIWPVSRRLWWQRFKHFTQYSVCSKHVEPVKEGILSPTRCG